jgi:hypothetical protein
MRVEWARLEARLKRPIPVPEFAMAVDAWSDGWTKPPAEVAQAVRGWRNGGDVDARLAGLCAEVTRRYSGRFRQHPGLAAYDTGAHHQSADAKGATHGVAPTGPEMDGADHASPDQST